MASRPARFAASCIFAVNIKITQERYDFLLLILHCSKATGFEYERRKRQRQYTERTEGNLMLTLADASFSKLMFLFCSLPSALLLSGGCRGAQKL